MTMMTMINCTSMLTLWSCSADVRHLTCLLASERCFLILSNSALSSLNSLLCCWIVLRSRKRRQILIRWIAQIYTVHQYYFASMCFLVLSYLHQILCFRNFKKLMKQCTNNNFIDKQKSWMTLKVNESKVVLHGQHLRLKGEHLLLLGQHLLL